MDINFDEVFGIETEAAAEAAQDTAAEAPEKEAAEPATEEKESEATDATETKPEQTPEERSRQAAGRRIREREEAARREERDRVSGILARLGIEDPDTGDPVDSVEKLEAYEQMLSDRRLASGKGTADDIKRIVRDAIREETKPSAPERDPRIDAELAEIARMDPDMAGQTPNDTLAAILNSDSGDKFRGYVDKGLSFIEAYRLAAADKLDKLRSGQAAEAARVKAASKEHLSSTSSRGQGAVAVPADELAYYKLLMPDATDAEIQMHYNADRKRYGPK